MMRTKLRCTAEELAAYQHIWQENQFSPPLSLISTPLFLDLTQKALGTLGHLSLSPLAGYHILEKKFG